MLPYLSLLITLFNIMDATTEEVYKQTIEDLQRRLTWKQIQGLLQFQRKFLELCKDYPDIELRIEKDYILIQEGAQKLQLKTKA